MCIPFCLAHTRPRCSGKLLVQWWSSGGRWEEGGGGPRQITMAVLSSWSGPQYRRSHLLNTETCGYLSLCIEPSAHCFSPLPDMMAPPWWVQTEYTFILIVSFFHMIHGHWTNISFSICLGNSSILFSTEKGRVSPFFQRDNFLVH